MDLRELSAGLMTEPPSLDVTALLNAWSDGDQKAFEQLLPLVYAELRRVARHRMRSARKGDVLQTTALIHEAYIRLIDVNRVRWQNRAHFFAVSAKLMRQVLVDAVRTSGARKRGGDVPHVAFDEALVPAPERGTDVGRPRRGPRRARADRSKEEPGGRTPLLRRPERGGDGRGPQGLGADGDARLADGEDCGSHGSSVAARHPHSGEVA